ncbi:hypothetical protein Z042_06320 [Chania multitudinisentens RB-25]|uniref:Fimbrial-type adhesion domain-containing protein n=1 Tax=Chania multitudinisentens RB-25 TaxID=1441930 RepID=W0LBC0_9GAMM|nr:fimbrial protein [Chania multitudinisentens]AHG19275.1 hypothetical protein Z042_06320 [Chania multitudinisentens RB-25]
MNKNLIAVAVLVTSAFTTNVFASNGEISFKGAIIPNPCDVTTDTANQVVQLGTIGVNAFKFTGDTAATRNFSIKLTNCPTTVTNAAVVFEGTGTGPVANDNSALALTDAPDVATGVGVQIVDAQNQVVKMREDSSAYPLLSGTAVNTLSFSASYVSTAATVTSGSANAVTNFTITYP